MVSKELFTAVFNDKENPAAQAARALRVRECVLLYVNEGGQLLVSCSGVQLHEAIGYVEIGKVQLLNSAVFKVEGGPNA